MEGVTQMVIGCLLIGSQLAVEATLLIGISWFGTSGEASLLESRVNVRPYWEGQAELQ